MKPDMHPGAMSAISRWLSAAIPPAETGGKSRILEGCE